MKRTRICGLAVLCLLSAFFANGATKYWVGPLNGDWSDRANWSNVLNGTGGAELPGTIDSVIFSTSARTLVHLNTSPTISFLRIEGNVTLYASTPVTFTLLRSLSITPFQTLKDSTSADVPFNFIFNGSAQSVSTIAGSWVFEGGVPINRLAGNGAGFTVEPGSKLTVLSLGSILPPASVIFKKNTNYISSDPSSLRFAADARYILENNTDAAIPNATWAGDSLSGTSIVLPKSSIRINGSIGKLAHLGTFPNYKDIVVDLPNQLTDASLDLPDGTVIDGNLAIVNTNNRTLALLAPTGFSSSVYVQLRPVYINGGPSYGNLTISANTKVAMAIASSASPATSYRLQVAGFSQTGGNFSLQDYNNATGPSMLSIRTNLLQTGGTFVTNSSSTDPGAKFIVEMNGPLIISGRFDNISLGQFIQMSGGTIDNGNHMVTLRNSHTQYNGPVSSTRFGVDLQSPLQVGNLELLKGTINTTDANIITVNNTDPAAVVVGTTGDSYVNGPMRRLTNSASAYTFPTGRGNIVPSIHYDPCVIVPVSATPSVYQAEYFDKGYTDLSVVSPLKGVSNTEYWNISKISGADAKVQLILNAPVAGATTTDGLVTAQYENADWVTKNGSVFTPGNSATGSVISKQLSNFGLFTFGYADPANLQQDTVITPQNGLNYKYYEGFFNTLPDFNTLTPVKTGNSANVNLDIRRSGVNDSFAVIWQGFINIPTAGLYTFETVSDDGSKLYFNSTYSFVSTALVNNDGTHPPQSASGTVNIPAAGKYPITITFFENYGGEGMQVYWKGPGFERQLIPDAAFGDSPPPPANGLTYKYYEGDFNSLPDFSTLTPVKTGVSPNVDLGVRPPGVNEHFAFMWEGYINIPTAGTYTFETVSDDGSKLYFNTQYSANGPALVNNDGIHASWPATGTITVAAAGLYPVSITFFEKDGGENMQVYWTGPGIDRQLIPDAAFTGGTPQPTSGLNYKYYEGAFNVLPDFNTLTPIKTGNSPNINLDIRRTGVNDSFAVVWEGYINMPTNGLYQFEIVSDDGSKMYFNSQYSPGTIPLIDNDGTHPPKSGIGVVLIQVPGKYPIAITFFENYGGEGIQVYWSGPGFARQLIPDAAFTPGAVPLFSKGLNYKYYEGDFNSLPDFTRLSPVKTGKTPNIDIGIRPSGVNDHFAFVWEGYIYLARAGTYTFETESDDGSNFSLGVGPPFVINDGVHAPTTASGSIDIGVPGLWPISVKYFEKDGGETMKLYWTGPEITRQLIPDEAFSSLVSGSSLTGLNATGLAATVHPNQALASPAKNATEIRKIYPNPFKESFNVDFYNTAATNKVSVEVYDLKGRLVHTYYAGRLAAGNNTLKINMEGRQLINGVYLAKLSINGIASKTIKLVKAKK